MENVGFIEPINTVVWNPKLPILAACSFGTGQPIVIASIKTYIEPNAKPIVPLDISTLHSSTADVRHVL
jgi:hypothetical protein